MIRKNGILILFLILMSLLPITSVITELSVNFEKTDNGIIKPNNKVIKCTETSLLYNNVYHTPEQVIEEIENFENAAPDIP